MIVDVHTHFVPRSAFEEIPGGFEAHWDEKGRTVSLSEGGRRGRPTSLVLTDLDALLDAQQANGVDVSIVGSWVDAMTAPRDAARQRDLCRHLSDETGAALQHVAGVRWLAALPDADGKMAAEELRRSVALGAVGGLIGTSFDRGGMARPDLEDLWFAAEEAGCPIVLHPGVFDPGDVPAAGGPMMIPFFYPYLTTRAAGELVAGSVPERHPDLKVVLVHAGGFLPYQHGRFDHWLRGRGASSESLRSRADGDYLRWFYYDTVVHSSDSVRFLMEHVAADRVLAGSDCPFPMADWQPFTSGEAGQGELSVLDASVLGGNAVDAFQLELP